VDFDRAKSEYLRLKAAFDAGEISAEQFEQAVYGLSFVDVHGQAWQIGLSSGLWYRKAGDAWVEATPPSGSAALERIQAAPAASPTVGSFTIPKALQKLPAWVWTLLALGSLATWLGIFSLITYYHIMQRPAPIAIARTLVVYGDETRAPVATVTRMPTPLITETIELVETPMAEETEAPLPTITLEPTATITARPPISVDLLPVRVWKLLSWSNFDRLENVRGEWRQTFDDSEEYDLGDYQFVNHKGLNSANFKYFTEFTDVLMATTDEELALSDLEIETMLAFRPGSEAGYLDIMCRFSDWIFTYAFTINSSQWALTRYNDEQETQLANGQLPAGFRNGDWGRVRMRCVGDTLSVWLNSLLLVSVRDTTFDSGQWAMTLYLNEGFSEADIYLNSHRVFYPQDQVALVGDMLEVGDTFVTLDSGWRREGTRYSLGVWIENRSAQALEISADQVYLLHPDGRRIPVDAAPPEANAFRFPLTIRESLRASQLYFSGLTFDDIDWGLQLVFDLRAAGLNELRFQLPVD
jgi:hypothetical protein